MEKAFLGGVKSAHAAKELNRIVENVTCLECCKYYVLPATAACGHTLCHGCWIGRQTCPVCALPLTRRTLKSNTVLKIYSDCAQTLVTTFEKLFNIKLDEHTQELAAQTKNTVKDPNKNVKAWLADSQNQFSAPVSSQQSTQVDGAVVEVGTCEIQVHTSSIKPASPTQIIVAPPPPQDDWDKIEIAPDTEDINKNKENVGPTNTELFSFEGDIYTTDHPRRSSRKRELKKRSNPSDNSIDKHSNVSVDTEKLHKVKQNWSNVKKMRKEFSKLHKKNKSKLNVSIEMCKKTQSAISKTVVAESAPSQQVVSIDECTPNVNLDKIYPTLTLNKVANDDDTKCNDKNDKDINSLSPESAPNSQLVINTQNNEEQIQINNEKQSSSICNSKNLNDHESISKPIELLENVMSKKNIPFLKKGALQKDKMADLKGMADDLKGETVNHIINDNNQTTDSDDIQITIKIGSTLTNIFIKKKKNDVKVKLNTDQGVQTSPCIEETVAHNSPSSAPKDIDVQNIEINIGSEGVVSAVTQQKISEAYDLTNKHDKTESTKKNTASAETVPYEITESVEKELSKIMECDGKTIDDVSSNSNSKSHQTQIEQPGQSGRNVKLLANEFATEASGKQVHVDEMEVDEDIFASGSVKESNVQPLQAMNPTPSEILTSTLQLNKKHTQTQRQADKRDRETNEEDNQSKKKLKVSTKIDSSINTEEISNNQNKDIENQSSSINYDLVMGQVFASIDADMDTVDKSQSIIKNNQSKTQIEKHTTTVLQHSQNLKTQLTQKKPLGPSKLVNSSQSINPMRQKDSEHLFTPSIKETQNVHQQKHGPETQAHIENLLTPGMCRDLASTSHIVSQLGQDDEKIQATPCEEKDDSDMSIYEDTPQKSSFTKKPSNKAGSGISGGQHQLVLKISAKQKSPNEKPNESRTMPSVINISDTDNTKTDKDVTVIESKPKQTLETPSTINQFYNHIKHNSTPVARKSLNFVSNQDKTLNSSTSMLAKNTQEQEIIARAFEPSQRTFAKPLPNIERLCLAASCLTAAEVKVVEKLCTLRKWVFVREFTKDLTHLVVGVDEDGRSQRTVKFMCAVAAGKWIVTYEWVKQCLHLGVKAPEWSFEALDWTGDPGPMRARIATRKLFEGITFFCKPPFTVLNEAVLKTMLEGAGGTVAASARAVRVAGPAPRLLLAEPEHTQENQFTYLALELGIVPVNYEWALNCLGSYALGSVRELLLCPAALLPPDTRRWPAALLAHTLDPDSGSDVSLLEYGGVEYYWIQLFPHLYWHENWGQELLGN